MIFQVQKNLRWYNVALWPVGLPVLAVGLLVVGAVALARMTRDRLYHGFWG